MGAALFGIFLAIDPWFDGRLPLKVAGLALLVIGGMAVYFGAAFALKAVGFSELKALTRRQVPPADTGET